MEASTNRNAEYAVLFREIADILAYQGENIFKIRSYRRASETLLSLDEPVEDILAREDRSKLPGFGSAIRQKTAEMIATGSCRLLNRLRNEVPAGILELLRMEDLTPEAVRGLQNAIGVDSADALKQAAIQGRLENMPLKPAIAERINKVASRLQ